MKMKELQIIDGKVVVTTTTTKITVSKETVEVPEGMILLKVVSHYYGSEREDEYRVFVFAVPAGSPELELELSHGDHSDNWIEELISVPSGTLMIDPYLEDTEWVDVHHWASTEWF